MATVAKFAYVMELVERECKIANIAGVTPISDTILYMAQYRPAEYIGIAVAVVLAIPVVLIILVVIWQILIDLGCKPCVPY